MAKPYGHQARKRFGQNFLQDTSIIDQITKAIRPSGHDNLVEIGPGRGALTGELLEKNNGKLVAIELDRDLIPTLKTQFFQHKDFQIIQEDALKFDFSSLLSEERSAPNLRVVGNLPYNISTPLIFHLLSHAHGIHDMHFMLQKEVVERLNAQRGTSAYGRLSVMVQYRCQVDYLLDVPPTAFFPVPAVDSAVVKLTPFKEIPHKASCEKTLEHIVRTAFSMRRKTIRNNVKKILSTEDLDNASIDPSERPEQISVESYVKLSNILYLRQQA